MYDDAPKQLPPLGLMRRHLRLTGWVGEVLPRGDLELFTLEVGDAKVEIVLPTATSNLMGQWMLPALRTLAELSHQNVRTVAAQISMLDFDIIRARLPDALVLRGSIRLRIAEKFTSNIRRFLASSAAAEQRRALVIEDAQKLGAEYAGECRFGHTFPGSFGFTIESPSGPAPDIIGAEPSPPPFQRRVIERIAKGIAAVERAYDGGNPDLLAAEAIEGRGMNLNMLEDLTALVADTSAEKISFSFSMAPQWPSVSDQLQVRVPEAALPLIDQVVSSLRPQKSSPTETIVGQVVMLQTRENPADLLHEGTREIAIDGLVMPRGEPMTLRVRLTPEDYLRALDAHSGGKAVAVTGTVTRSSRGNQLNTPTDFRVA